MIIVVFLSTREYAGGSWHGVEEDDSATDRGLLMWSPAHGARTIEATRELLLGD